MTKEIKKNTLKIAYKIISVQKQSSRGVLQGRCPRNEVNPQENTEARFQQSRVATLLKFLCMYIYKSIQTNVLQGFDRYMQTQFQKRVKQK